MHCCFTTALATPSRSLAVSQLQPAGGSSTLARRLLQQQAGGGLACDSNPARSVLGATITSASAGLLCLRLLNARDTCDVAATCCQARAPYNRISVVQVGMAAACNASVSAVLVNDQAWSDWSVHAASSQGAGGASGSGSAAGPYLRVGSLNDVTGRKAVCIYLAGACLSPAAFCGGGEAAGSQAASPMQAACQVRHSSTRACMRFRCAHRVNTGACSHSHSRSHGCSLQCRRAWRAACVPSWPSAVIASKACD